MATTRRAHQPASDRGGLLPRLAEEARVELGDVEVPVRVAPDLHRHPPVVLAARIVRRLARRLGRDRGQRHELVARLACASSSSSSSSPCRRASETPGWHTRGGAETRRHAPSRGARGDRAAGSGATPRRTRRRVAEGVCTVRCVASRRETTIQRLGPARVHRGRTRRRRRHACGSLLDDNALRSSPFLSPAPAQQRTRTHARRWPSSDEQRQVPTTTKNANHRAARSRALARHGRMLQRNDEKTSAEDLRIWGGGRGAQGARRTIDTCGARLASTVPSPASTVALIALIVVAVLRPRPAPPTPR